MFVVSDGFARQFDLVKGVTDRVGDDTDVSLMELAGIEKGAKPDQGDNSHWPSLTSP
jgi:hypothetical protein